MSVRIKIVGLAHRATARRIKIVAHIRRVALRREIVHKVIALRIKTVTQIVDRVHRVIARKVTVRRIKTVTQTVRRVHRVTARKANVLLIKIVIPIVAHARKVIVLKVSVHPIKIVARAHKVIAPRETVLKAARVHPFANVLKVYRQTIES